MLLLALFTVNLVSCSSDDKEEKIVVPELTDRNSIQFTVNLTRWRDMEVYIKGSFGIDWGDGTVEKKTNSYTAAMKHKYDEIGEYVIKVWCEELTNFKYELSDSKAIASDLKIGNCPKLTEMTLANFVETSYLDLRACHNLEKLTVGSFADLTEVDIANCTKLEEFSCFSNPKLAAIDLSKNKKLESLKCYENALVHLSLKENEELLTLKASDNELKTIDFGKIATLTEIDVQGNQLTDIDLTLFEELESFDGSYNQFTFLDFSNNEVLIDALCAKNQITGFALNEEAPIHKFICNGNSLDADALNTLFTELPPSSVISSRNYTTPNSIAFYDNPGEFDCSVKIIKEKGWKVEVKK